MAEYVSISIFPETRSRFLVAMKTFQSATVKPSMTIDEFQNELLDLFDTVIKPAIVKQ